MDNIYREGKLCGSLTWRLFRNGGLAIKGEGALEFAEGENPPWSDVLDRITSVSIYQGIETIPAKAFENAGELRILRASHVTQIGESAFRNCRKLHTARLDRVKRVESLAFEGCVELKHIFGLTTAVDANWITANKELGHDCFLGTPFERDARAANNGLFIVDGVLLGGLSGEESVAIPHILNQIGERAYEMSGPKRLTVWSPSLREIRESAFGCSMIEELILPRNVFKEFGTPLRIDSMAFACSQLKTFACSSPVICCSESFYGCANLGYVCLTGENISLRRAFWSCKSLRAVYLSEGVTSIQKGEFSECHRQLTIYTPQGSYAQRYAEKHGIRWENADSPSASMFPFPTDESMTREMWERFLGQAGCKKRLERQQFGAFLTAGGFVRDEKE